MEDTNTEDPAPVLTPAPVKRRAPRRPAKPDELLSGAVDKARAALLEVIPAEQIGEHVGVVPEADRLVTHRFASHLAGYGGWHWYATLARVPRGKDATVCEIGLLPSSDAVLSPDWLPWARRVRPEDTAAAGEAAGVVTPGAAAEDGTEPARTEPAGTELAGTESTGVEKPAGGEPTS